MARIEIDDMREVLFAILRGADGKFLSVYQICKRIEGRDNDLWARLTAAYTTDNPPPEYGPNAGTYYAPSSRVAHALKQLKDQDSHLLQGVLDCSDLVFRDVDTGRREISIWAWQEDS